LAIAEKASFTGTRPELARRTIKLAQAEKELKELTAVKLTNGVNGRIASMWKGIESLLFNMYQVDKK
jgi:hypothetical protein